MLRTINMKLKFNFTFVPSAAALVALAPVPVCAQHFLSVEQAQAAMFPGEKLKAAPVTLTAEQIKQIEKDSGVRVRDKELRVWRAGDGGLFIVDEVLGKHEMITWALGLRPDGSVKQIEILDYRETYGYEIQHPKWRAQFEGKRAGAPLKLDADIKNISGATLSCRHITDGVKRLLATYEHALK
jgi:Na+-translocating ferredoxin:NAD+ oxidoreductase RnfG subunit